MAALLTLVGNFALYAAFRHSLVRRDSHDYYSGSVIVDLAVFR
jgi:hypothetical protein